MNKEYRPQRESNYLNANYDYKGRFLSYWHQINEIVTAINGQPGKILEIGPGNRFMTNYLLNRGFDIETLDIDAVHSPNYVGSVDNIPVMDKSFDVVVCFQVLEHLPFEQFVPALKEMARVARKSVLFSVPDVRYFLEIQLSLFSARRKFHYILSFPRLTNRNLPPPKEGGHLWEIGRPAYPLSKIIRTIPTELKLIRSFRIPGNPIHQMFITEI